MIGHIGTLLRRFSRRGVRRPAGRVNLLVEVASFDKGGLEKVVLDMASRLDGKTFEVTIVSVNQSGYLGEVAKQRGLRVICLAGDRGGRRYRKILEEHEITLSNSHFSHHGYPVFYERKIPNVTFIHNVYAFLSGRALHRLRTNDKYVDVYVAVSRNAARYASEKIGLPAKKIVTIPNGLVVGEHEARWNETATVSRRDLGLGESDYVFLNVASYNLHKGHYLMADAMRRIVRLRKDIKIVCLGNVVFAPHVDELRRYLKEAGLEGHIVMPGYFPRVDSFFKISDAFLLPSFIEGWSMAMNEAMFYEKPMILTDTGGAPEVIENGDIGILIENEYGDILNLDSRKLDAMAYQQREFRTSEKLATVMMNFADRREYWKEAGKRGREKVLERYNFDNIVKRYEEVFCSVLPDKGFVSKEG